MQHGMIRHRVKIFTLIIGVGLMLLLGGVFVGAAAASGSAQLKPQFEFTEGKTIDNGNCFYCHAQPELSLNFPNGDSLSLTIDPGRFDGSAHQDFTCDVCHAEITGYPHDDTEAISAREFSLQMYSKCQECHQEQYDKTLDSVHMREVTAGNENAAVCTDCHDPHTQEIITDHNGTLLPEARLSIPALCAQCHSAIYDKYEESVHGAALTQEGNNDVPTCIDCHGVHNISDPTTNAFRLTSPEICARCHTDPSIMDRYGISTKVLDTYMADFHGTTVTIFEKTDPEQETNKPVCYDCHGVHDIKRVDDPVYGFQMKENILVACQRCHPDASTNFPAAWMNHYIPSADEYPIVYYVNLFYKFFIPAVIGSMSIFVVSDIVRRLIERRKGARQA